MVLLGVHFYTYLYARLPDFKTYLNLIKTCDQASYSTLVAKNLYIKFTVKANITYC